MSGSHAGERSVDEALAELRTLFGRVGERETVGVREAYRRVLAADVVSEVDLPAFDNAAMDGYAVRAQDCSANARLRMMGTALAGHPFEGALSAGRAVRIMTGAPLPHGADAVVMLEDSDFVDGEVRLAHGIAPEANVRRRGEHVRSGERVLTAGRRLSAQDLGLAAGVGAATVDVVRRLKVGVLSTGDELVDAPARLPTSAAYDGNRPLLCALAAAWGHEVIDCGISADTPQAFAPSLAQAAAAGIDILLTTGGAAQGDADIVRHHRDVHFVSLDFRPGRGVAAGQVRSGNRNLALLGLPGNAVAAYVVYQLVARPLLAWMAGAEVQPPLRLSLPITTDARIRPGRIEWRRARFVPHSSGPAAELLREQGSAMLRTVSEADALVAIGPHSARAGDLVPAIPLAAFD
jgi:molybdopterin molybdotransferase